MYSCKMIQKYMFFIYIYQAKIQIFDMAVTSFPIFCFQNIDERGILYA